MLEALYRKYRPQNFKELVGQNPIKVTLENEIINKRIAHAYLFSGPRGVGKTTTARLLAKSINCPNHKEAEPCNKCDFCQEISKGRSMDLIEIDAASHTGVDNVRENIIENARFTPQRAEYKIFIIDEVHMLSLSAFNALLKTLEEPPSHVIFILATTEIHRVPDTIISRCQRFDFKKVSVKDLVERLKFIIQQEKVKVDEQILVTIARRSDGSVRDAEVLLAQLLSLNEENISAEEAALVIPRSDIGLVIELFEYLIKKDAASSIALINRLSAEGVNIQEFSKELIEFLRKLLLIKISKSLDEFSSIELDKEQTKSIVSQLETITVDSLLDMIEQFLIYSKEIRFSNIPQLPLEIAVLSICKEPDESSVDIVEPKKTVVTSNKPVKPEIKQSTDKVKLSEKTVKATKKPAGDNSSISLESIVKAWSEILEQLRDYNHSIALTLKVGIPVEVKNNTLIVGFRFKFHADRIKERKVYIKIEEVLEQIFKTKIGIKARLLNEDEVEKLKTQEQSVAESSDIMGQLSSAFDGDLITE